MSAPSTLADCCPKCDPFDFTACLPLVTPTEEPDHPGSLCAFYKCPRGHEWTCWWDAAAAEWPTPRRAALMRYASTTGRCVMQPPESPRCGKPMIRYEAANGPMFEQPACARPEGHAGMCRSAAALMRKYAADAARTAVARAIEGRWYGRPGLRERRAAA